MIIFNALAIVVALICGLFLGPLFWLFPTFMESTWGDVVACGVVSFVSIVCDLVGLKGRVFFLPIWLFGLIGVGVNLHTMWGWYGPALAAAIVVALFAGMMFIASVAEKKEWAAAPAKLVAARDSLAKGVSDETWELLSAAYFVPAFGSETPEVGKHNLEVLALVRKALPENAPALELRLLEALGVGYRAAMVPKVEGEEKKSVPTEFTSALQELLQNKGKLPEDEDRKDLLEELNKLSVPAAT